MDHHIPLLCRYMQYYMVQQSGHACASILRTALLFLVQENSGALAGADAVQFQSEPLTGYGSHDKENRGDGMLVQIWLVM